MSVRRVARNLKKKGVKISRETVRRAAHKANLTAYKTRKRPLLTLRQKLKRLQYAKKYKDHPWRSTLFTDEKTWWYGKEGQSFVWTDDIDDPKLNNEQVKHPYKVHAWGGISWYGKTDLYLFEENMDTDLFCKILRTKMLPGATVRHSFNGSTIFFCC